MLGWKFDEKSWRMAEFNETKLEKEDFEQKIALNEKQIKNLKLLTKEVKDERDKILKENEDLNKLIESLKDVLSDKSKRMEINLKMSLINFFLQNSLNLHPKHLF